MNNTRPPIQPFSTPGTISLLNPFSKPAQTPQDRAILDNLKRSCAELETAYGLTWHLRPRFPSWYERIYKNAKAA